MRLLLLGLLLFCGFALTARWVYVCHLRGHCATQDTSNATQLLGRPLTLALMQGDSAVIDEFQQFAFAKNSPEPIFTENNRVFLATVLAWMQAFPKWHLQIKGYQLLSESNERAGWYDWLALARAAALRDSLVQMGASASQIDLDFDFLPDSIGLSQPIACQALLDDRSHIHQPYTFSHMTFTNRHFLANSDLFEPAPSFFYYADSLRAWSKTLPNAQLRITAYADSEASTESAQRRAQYIADFLKAYGVGLQMEIANRGVQQHLVPLSDPLSSLKNRRVEIQLLPMSISE